MTLKEIVYDLKEELGDKPYFQMTFLEALSFAKWLDKIKPKTVIELGTAYGASGRLIQTVIPNVKLITIDLPVAENVSGKYNKYNFGRYIWVKHKEDLGKFLLDGAEIIEGDGCVLLPELIEKYNPDLVFHDSSHKFEVVTLNIKQCYEGKVPWIVVHDSHKSYLRPFMKNNDMYEEVFYMKDRAGLSVLKLKDEI